MQRGDQGLGAAQQQIASMAVENCVSFGSLKRFSRPGVEPHKNQCWSAKLLPLSKARCAPTRMGESE